MKKLIRLLLVFSMVMAMIGCNSGEKPAITEEEIEIADFDYSRYQVYPVESHKANSGRPYTDDNLPVFTRKMILELLGNEENQIFSPFNLYLNLNLMAGLTSGDARREILDLLGKEEDTLLKDYQALWKAYYADDGKRVSEYANSIWLNENLDVNDDKLKQIADDYFVPGFRGDMGSRDYTRAFQSWMNDNTGKMMGKQISGLEFDPGTLMAVASTIYYSNRWQYEYDPLKTKDATFHGVNGNTKAPFMNKTCSGFYVEGNGFSGIMDMFGNGEGYMLFLMPDEGGSIRNVFESEDFLKLIDGSRDEFLSPCLLELSLPKFDVDSKFKIEEILPRLGVRSMFDAGSNAFAELSSTPMEVDKIEHACRLILDEEGVKAAAYTVDIMYGGGPTERRKVVFDRPFIFMIMPDMKNVMFCGVINQL